MNSKQAGSGTDIALIAVFAALLAVLAVVPGVPMPGSSMPITLQTLGVLLAGLVLGPWRGALSVLLYLLVGFAGLPIFAQGSGGLAVFSSMSIGYLLSFPLAALVSGGLASWFVRSGFKGRYLWLTIAAVVGSFLVIDTAGITGMMIVGQVDLLTSFIYNLPFVLGDAIKCFAAAAIAVAVNKAFPLLLASRKPVAA
ncbi:MAG: biotin transporter BioY [Propionibacteriaceae bacterium]|jgi:biotin transport system substrate-specific component|nr:biotin transporter BioY [Propionibacteriaceae bacterium]